MDLYQSYEKRFGYNILPKAGSHLGAKRSLETKKSMSLIAKERNARPEYNKMISDRCKRQHESGALNITPESQAKAGRTNKGRKMSEEQKQKLRETALANREKRVAAAKASVEARRRMVEEDPTAKTRLYGSNKGKKFSEEARQKMSASAHKRWRG
jgi:inactivated superfamily I helicase